MAVAQKNLKYKEIVALDEDEEFDDESEAQLQGQSMVVPEEEKVEGNKINDLLQSRKINGVSMLKTTPIMFNFLNNLRDVAESNDMMNRLKNEHYERNVNLGTVEKSEQSKAMYMRSLPRIKHIIGSRSQKDIEMIVKIFRVIVSKESLQ